MAKDSFVQPKLNFISKKHIEDTELANQKERREFVKISEAFIKVKLADIAIRKGFNVRTNFDDVPDLAESILSIGLQQPPIVEVLKDGTVILNAGERRVRALKHIVSNYPERAKEFEFIKAQLLDRNMDETTRTLSMLVENTGKPLDPMEEAEGFRRLRDGADKSSRKMTITDIAKAVGKSIPYVEQRLILADATDEEKEMLRSGQILPTAFVKLTRETRKEVETEMHSSGPKTRTTAPTLPLSDEEPLVTSDKKDKADNTDIPHREDNTVYHPATQIQEDSGPAIAVSTGKKKLDKKEVDNKVSEKRKEKIKATVKATGQRMHVNDVKPVAVVEMIDAAINLSRKLNKLIDGGEGANLLFELDSKLREIKRAVK
jgi:ParB/RepB/Spo0J family partition protein